MRRLMKLEIKKFKLFSYVKGIVISNLAIMAMLCLVYFADKSEGRIPFESYEMAFGVIGSLVRGVFIIFASVLIARIIIDEYRTKSITLLFMYPIKRQRMMAAKLALVAGFTFLTIFLSNIVIGTIFYAVDSYVHFVPKELTGQVLGKNFLIMTLSAIACAGTSLVPLYFGMRKKSVPATIVAAILLVSFTNSSSNTSSLVFTIAIPIVLALIGGFIAYLSIRNVEKADIT
ncbi:ABC transporter permease [Aneurinibacillus tyrosinisolvens]|uniref:ABC transporter permease n=1 Tax=Aneurinibacillus tyrosinisolvens TaxID=1443435 RepID=UPI00069C41C1|nr:ABC transporter permease [Aneurinibacillus tyrosinisolvens]